MRLGIDPNALRYRDELIRYGIGYVDALDFLYVGRRFMEEPDLADLCVAGACPSVAVELLREPYGTTHVGAKFNGTAGLAQQLWNGQLPDPCKVSFASDLADVCLIDPASVLLKEQSHRLEGAREIHRRARLFTEELALVPHGILNRIREHIGRNPKSHIRGQRPYFLCARQGTILQPPRYKLGALPIELRAPTHYTKQQRAGQFVCPLLLFEITSSPSDLPL